jgi:hypothetical protein
MLDRIISRKTLEHRLLPPQPRHAPTSPTLIPLKNISFLFSNNYHPYKVHPPPHTPPCSTCQTATPDPSHQPIRWSSSNSAASSDRLPFGMGSVLFLVSICRSWKSLTLLLTRLAAGRWWIAGWRLSRLRCRGLRGCASWLATRLRAIFFNFLGVSIWMLLFAEIPTRFYLFAHL